MLHSSPSGSNEAMEDLKQTQCPAALYNMFFLKVQTAFNFSRGRIAVALLDVDDTVLFDSYS